MPARSLHMVDAAPNSFPSSTRTILFWSNRLGLVLLCFCGAVESGTSQVLRFVPPRFTSAGDVTLNFSAPAGQFVRVDSSTNLLSWRPLAVVLATNGLGALIDLSASNLATRFYRGTLVEPRTRILDFIPSSGPQGTRVEIFGQFFESARPGDNVVRIAGVQARVLELDQTRLVVEVPAGATTGSITVQTPRDQVASVGSFIVTASVQGDFRPPTGIDPLHFSIANTYGAAVPGFAFSGAGSHFSTFVRQGMPLITIASPQDQSDKRFFYAVTLSANEQLVIDAASTAHTLVFWHPLFMTHDPFLAGQILGLIRQNADVLAFEQTVAQVYLQSLDPSTNARFQQAYSNAVWSVADASAPLAAARQRLMAQPAPPRQVSEHPLDLDFLYIESVPGKARTRKISAVGNNPIDWLVSVRDIDVDRAFPYGLRDFNLQPFDRDAPPQLYPLGTNFVRRRLAEADLITSRLDLVGFLSDSLVDKLTDGLGLDDIEFPDQDGIYVMRGVGIAREPDSERNFVDTYLPNEALQVDALNIINAGMDLVSMVFDLRGVLNSDPVLRNEFLEKLLVEANRSTISIQGPVDFVKGAVQLGGFTLEFFAGAGLKAGAKAAAAAGAEALKKYIETATVVLEILSIASSLGQVIERATGLYRTTPMESALIVVGNPFDSLVIVSITPARASPGDQIEVLINKAQFDPNNPNDKVVLQVPQAPDVFITQVLEVENLQFGRQKLTLRLPPDPKLIDGEYRLTVLAQGKRGRDKFNILARPTVTAMTETAGFAATAGFLGSDFAGTPVTILGYGFSVNDRFVFNGGVESINKLGSPGNVTVYVPSGAQSGPVTVLRQVSSNEVLSGQTADFKVLGPPIIREMSPQRGPVGTHILLRASNLGTWPDFVRVQLNAFPPFRPNFGEFAGELISINAPAELAPATNEERTVTVTLLTPAGVAQRTFIVEPGRAGGAIIQVGGGSVITLERALALAAGTPVLPHDDADRMGGQELDPPYEEGDFITPDLGAGQSPRWPLGAAFADTIVIDGDVVGEGIFASDYDTIRAGPNGGRLIGTLTITGSYTTNNITVSGSTGHGIVLSGRNNTLHVTCDANTGDGLRLAGGTYNSIALIARSNNGNGMTLTAGAVGNEIFIETGLRTNVSNAIPNSGNRGHGILLFGDVRDNVIQALGNPGLQIGASGNRADGVRLEGAGVIGNVFSNGLALFNGVNGMTINGPVSNNVIRFNCHANGDCGIAYLGAPAGSPRQTLIDAACSGNTGYGILVSGVEGEGVSLIPGFARVFVSGGNNQLANARLENGSTGLRCDFDFVGGTTGLELVGAGISNNLVDANIRHCTGDGILITNAQENTLRLQAYFNGGNGILISGASRNQVGAWATLNGNDGVVLTDQAHHNRVYGFQHFNRNGLVARGGSHHNLFDELGSARNSNHGVVLEGNGTTDNEIINAQIGLVTLGGGNDLDGIRIQGGASRNLIGNGAGQGATIQNNFGAGIRLTGSDTVDNDIRGCIIGSEDAVTCSPPGPVRQAAGIVVEEGARRVSIGGWNSAEQNSIAGANDGILIRTGAREVVIQNNLITKSATNGVVIQQATGVAIGGGAEGMGNFLADQPVGVLLAGVGTSNITVVGNRVVNHQIGVSLQAGATRNTVGPNNLVVSNETGILLSAATLNELRNNFIQNNTLVGVLLDSGAAEQTLRFNSISGNGTGVHVTGNDSLRNTIRNNSITANQAKGIQLSNGGNQQLAAPQISGFDGYAISGSAAAPDGSLVELFKDPADEGEQPLLLTALLRGRFQTPLQIDPTQLGAFFHLTATVTDSDGNTSEFGADAPSGAGASISKVAFRSTRTGNPQLYLLDGFTTPVQLTTDSGNVSQPAFAPGGRALAFVSDRDGNSEIYLMATAGNAVALRLTTNNVPEDEPAWSPDGTQIVFVSERDGNAELYLMQTNGTGLTRLTANLAEDRSPSFSSDGTRIVFASNRSGNFDLYVLELANPNTQAIVIDPGTDTSPTWAPNGDAIAFVSNRDGNSELYLVQADGSGLRRLTNHPAADIDPAWLANGTDLIFSSNRDEGFELYILKLASGTAARLSVSAGDNSQPSAATR